jgi:N5-(cytidine 5'-diphosphoramidyl)-L-glutamine hydrolase
MKTVVVSQRIDNYVERNEIRDAIDQKLTLWLSQAGYIVIPVPNQLALVPTAQEIGFHDWIHSIKPDAIVLSGGNDIGEFIERDNLERALLAYACHLKIPVLGLCRGMQMMAVVGGVELKPVAGHVRKRHRLKGQITDEVNSYHHLALSQCPTDYTVLASSDDNQIEAIQHQHLPWQGWMWHPERELIFSDQDTQRLKALFK